MIHGANQTVTEEKIKAIFKELNLEFSSKLAQKFALPATKYTDMLSNPCGGAAVSAAPVEAVKEEKKEVKKEESDDDIALDF